VSQNTSFLPYRISAVISSIHGEDGENQLLGRLLKYTRERYTSHAFYTDLVSCEHKSDINLMILWPCA